MSAGVSAESLVQRSVDHCAPRFREAIEAAIAECNAQGLDAYVYESLRSEELQRLYYARGRERDENGIWQIVNKRAVVTNAKSALYSWHIYGLAVDVISRANQWEVSDAWRERVNVIMRSHGLKCGADWPHPDTPHVQWGKCKRTPSDRARLLYAQGGKELVWQVVGAAA